MPISLDQVRRNCQKARLRMAQAREQKWAFGAFNIDDQPTLRAICAAAQKYNAPVMVELSLGEANDMDHDVVRDMVDEFKKEYGIEIYINLDHSPSVEEAKRGIDAGYEFIHIDISQANHDATDEEIIAATKEVVEYAKFTGAIVEAEPHYFGGSSNRFKEAFDYEEIKKTFSTPEGAKEFVDVTGIETFAAAVGNLHGKYPVPKKLDLELLQKVRDAIDCNISLHGGSGTPGHYFKSAVEIGVTKVNINSDLRVAYRETLDKAMAENPDEIAVSKLVMKYVVPAVQKVVEEKILMFNSAGKAALD